MLKNKTKTTKDHQNNFHTSKPKLYEVLHVTCNHTIWYHLGNNWSRITKFNSTSRISPINYLKIKIIYTSVIHVQLICSKQLSIFKTVGGIICIIARGILLTAAIFP